MSTPARDARSHYTRVIKCARRARGIVADHESWRALKQAEQWLVEAWALFDDPAWAVVSAMAQAKSPEVMWRSRAHSEILHAVTALREARRKLLQKRVEANG